MKIAYGTYAMPTVPLEQALPLLAEIGYDGVEVCLSPKHHRAMPDDFDTARRSDLRRLLSDCGLGVPAMFSLGHLFHVDESGRRSTRETLRRAAELGRGLGMDEPPVVAMGIGGKSAHWEKQHSIIVDVLSSYADLAVREDFVIAGEAHCNAAVDRIERAVWLFDQIDSPRVRLHFDIVHFFVGGEDIERAVRHLLPYTAHTHVTDARLQPDGKFRFVLPGEGDLDIVRYVRAMHEGGWSDFITLELSTMVWSHPNFDPLAAAESCYRILTQAFAAAGVERDQGASISSG